MYYKPRKTTFMMTIEEQKKNLTIEEHQLIDNILLELYSFLNYKLEELTSNSQNQN